MQDTMMEIASQMIPTPACTACGGKTQFELDDVSGIRYTGRVRLACGCGQHGSWHDYPLYGNSIPMLWDVLRGVSRAYTGGADNAG